MGHFPLNAPHFGVPSGVERRVSPLGWSEEALVSGSPLTSMKFNEIERVNPVLISKMTDLVRRPQTYMYLTYLRVGRGAQLAATHIAPV